MTTFKCRECENFWNEGPTRDHKTDQLCRECLTHKLKVCRADVSRAMEADSFDAAKCVLTTIFITTDNAING